MRGLRVLICVQWAALSIAAAVPLVAAPCLAQSQIPPGAVVIGETTGDAVLEAFKTHIYLTPLVNPPFELGEPVDIVQVTQPFLTIRTYVVPKDIPSKAGQTGGWIMPIAELRGLTRAQILDRWALPIYSDGTRNNELTLVLVPAGTIFWSGPAGAITHSVDGTGYWGLGGGTQYYVGWGAAGIDHYQLDLTDYVLASPMDGGPVLALGPRLAGNAAAVGRYLDGLNVPAYTDLDTILTSLDVISIANPGDVTPLQGAVNQLSPERYGAVGVTAGYQRNLLLDALDPHGSLGASDPAGAGPVKPWAWAAGAWTRQDSRGPFTGFKADSWAGLLGVDARPSEDLRFRAAAGYVSSSLRWSDAGASTGGVGTAMISLRADYEPRGAFAAASFAGGYSWIDVHRVISVADTGLLPRGFSTALDRTAIGQANGAGASVRLEGGPRFASGPVSARLLAGVDYAAFHRDGFTEQDAGAANLMVAGRTDQLLGSRLGGDAAVDLSSSGTIAWRLEWGLVWTHRLAGSDDALGAGLVDEPGLFTVATAGAPRWTLQPRAGLVGRFMGGEFALRYQGQFGAHDRSNAATASLAVRF